jgi:NADH:ubiquinone oxidoreductase subunit E
MLEILENIPATDPLANPDQKILIDQILEENKRIPGAAMVVLGELQSEIGFISPHMQAYVADQLKVPVSQIHGVVSFYSFFTTTPRGKHTVKFCLGTACYVSGAPQLIEQAKEILGVDLGETTEDGMITLETCRCIGACSQAPAMTVDKDVYGRVQTNTLPQILRRYQEK